MVRTPHLDIAYERELDAVSAHLQRMSDHARAMVDKAVQSALGRDAALAAEVEAADEALDALEIAADQVCVRVMARFAPVGADLRLVTAALKIVTDIERIGDLAVNIAKRGLEVNGGIGGLPPEVVELARVATGELELALRALNTRDANLARRLRDEDRSTDARNRAAFQRLVQLGHDRQDAFSEVLALTSVCRHLERIGDHAVNIAEMVVYVVEGRMLRHLPDETSD